MEIIHANNSVEMEGRGDQFGKKGQIPWKLKFNMCDQMSLSM